MTDTDCMQMALKEAHEAAGKAHIPFGMSVDYVGNPLVDLVDYPSLASIAPVPGKIEKNGLSDSVKVEFKGEHTELASLLAAGQAEIAMLPEPFVTVASYFLPLKVAVTVTSFAGIVNVVFSF